MKQPVAFKRDGAIVHADAMVITLDKAAHVTGDYVQFVHPETGERFVMSGIEFASLAVRMTADPARVALMAVEAMKKNAPRKTSSP